MKRSILPVVLLMVFVCASGYADTSDQAMLDANADVDQYVSSVSWFIGGFICGCFAPLYAVIDTADVPASRLVGKPSEYVLAYTSAYQSKAKSKRIKISSIGCVVGTAVGVVVGLLTNSE